MRAGRAKIAAIVGACATAIVLLPASNAQAATPSLRVVDVRVTETDAAGVVAPVVVRLSAKSDRTVTVQYTTVAGSAKTPADYATKAGQITIPAGTVKKTVQIPIKGDDLDEAAEQFTVKLSSPTKATIADATGVVRITDDDAPPSVDIGDGEADEGPSSATESLDLPITLSEVSGRKVTVTYDITGGTAGVGDRGAASGTFVIPAGTDGGTVSIDVIGDDVDEADETVVLSLADPRNATLGDASGTGTIRDDDGPAISVADDATVEGGNHIFVITLDSPSPQDIDVSWATADGTATAPGDYTGGSGTAHIDQGAVQTQVQVANVEDSTDEDHETFTVGLSAPVNATIDDGSGIGTIIDDDGPSIVISNESKTEGWSGTSPNELTFDINLSAASVQTVTVDWTTAPDTATSPADFVAVSGTATFDPGETTETAVVTVNGDLADESNEQFQVTLSNPSNATISDSSGTGTINDDDCTDGNEPGPPASVNLGSVSGDEGSDNVFRSDLICQPSEEDWYLIFVTEDVSGISAKDLTARVHVAVNEGPAQTVGDLDLYVYASNCSTLIDDSKSSGTFDEAVYLKKEDELGSDSGFTACIRVDAFNGVNSYQLQVNGNFSTSIAPNVP